MGDRRHALHRSLVIAAGLACFATPHAAFAQGADEDAEQPAPPAKDPAVVKTWLSAGDTLVKKGDAFTKQGKTADAKTSYENAVTAYQKAIAASDEPSAIQMQLAIAYDKLGDAPAALRVLKTVVGAEGVRADIAKKAQARFDELSMKVGVVTLTVIPDGTTVMIEGTQVGEAPLPEPLWLAPGKHVVTFSAVGYQPKDVELKIEAGSESERKIELEPVPVVTRPDTTEDVESEPLPPQPTSPSKLPLYVGGGAAVGLLLVGTVTGIAAVGKQGQFEDSTSPTERADLRSSGKSLALVTDLCLVGAVGAAAFTAYWYTVKYRPEAKALAERQATRHHKGHGNVTKVDVLPWVQPDAGGLVAVGAF